jgi:predicted GNAT family acetyltransferase
MVESTVYVSPSLQGKGLVALVTNRKLMAAKRGNLAVELAGADGD